MPGRELYTRDEEGAKFDATAMELSDDISFLILSIETLLFTRKKEVLGAPGLGVNLEDLLFTLNSNNSEIKSALVTQIFSYCPLALTYSVEVDIQFFRGEYRDVAVLDIIVDGRKAISAVL